MHLRALFALALASVSCASLSCSSSSSGDAPADLTIEVGNNYYKPATGTIKKGQTVEWVWKQGAHNVVSGTHDATGSTCTPDGKWSSGDVQYGGTYRHTFDEAGDFPYFCTPHCSDKQWGTITVQ